MSNEGGRRLGIKVDSAKVAEVLVNGLPVKPNKRGYVGLPTTPLIEGQVKPLGAEYTVPFRFEPVNLSRSPKAKPQIATGLFAPGFIGTIRNVRDPVPVGETGITVYVRRPHHRRNAIHTLPLAG